MITCSLCVGGEKDEVKAMLERTGVTGPALAAVHEILVPCRPNDACVSRIQEAVVSAARSVPGLMTDGKDHVPALAALLAVLDGFGDQPLDLIASKMRETCASACHRRGPGGKMWNKAMIKVRDRLIGDGHHLLVEAMAGRAGAGLVIARPVVGDEGALREAEPKLTLSSTEIQRLGNVADRVLRLARLAIVKKVGRNVTGSGPSKNPLRIKGLRVRGETGAWSDLHNCVSREVSTSQP